MHIASSNLAHPYVPDMIVTEFENNFNLSFTHEKYCYIYIYIKNKKYDIHWGNEINYTLHENETEI